MAVLKMNWLAATLLASSLTGVAFAKPVTVCNAKDFTAGNNRATDCAFGPMTNTEQAAIKSLFGGDWSMTAQYNKAENSASGLPLAVSADGTGFSWSLPPTSIGKIKEAVFVISRSNTDKKSSRSGWVAYKFDALLTSVGKFFTCHSFKIDDFSQASLYTSSKSHQAVPEIDGAGIALALLTGIMSLVNERRKS